MQACCVQTWAQSCPTLCNPMDCSLPGSSVHGNSRQKYWNGFSFPSPGDFPNPGMEPESLTSLSLAGGFFTTNATWESPQTKILVVSQKRQWKSVQVLLCQKSINSRGNSLMAQTIKNEQQMRMSEENEMEEFMIDYEQRLGMKYPSGR